MKSYISMFEIPATDISRAINFYQALLDIKIEKMDVEGMQMGILPYEGQMVTGVIIQADGIQTISGRCNNVLKRRRKSASSS
jgi:predicted enzyme related to lactoylglutathione lyase